MRQIVIGLALLAATATVTSPAVGQAPGSADPLGLASEGILIPFFASSGNFSSLEVASPVGDNQIPPLRLVFYRADCTRSDVSRVVPLSVNGIAVINLNAFVHFDGLLVIAGSANNGFTSVPLSSPLHARVRWTHAVKNFVRTLDPITVRNAEGAVTQTWNPLRTAAAFIVPRQGPTFASSGRFGAVFDNESTLYLVCPSLSIIQEIPGTPPLIPPGAGRLAGAVYDAAEHFLSDVEIPCSCLTAVRMQDIDRLVYTSPVSTEYYTEIYGVGPGSFTGYLGTERRVFFGDPSDDFTRLRNGQYQNIIGGGPAVGGIDTGGR